MDPRRSVKIGLIADTHMPARWPDLPPALAGLFQNLDLILHAGDVGELWVLEKLSRYAPVVAVHGNDDSADAARTLPAQQLLLLHGKRLLLWHGHYADPDAERASRRSDRISPQRLEQRAAAAGADILVFGHWHIPFTHRAGDLLIINPGAIASGNASSRQLIQSVAVLTIDPDGTTAVTHTNLAAVGTPFQPTVAWEAGFDHNHARFSAPIWSPALLARRSLFFQEVYPLAPQELEQIFRQLARPCWAGEKEQIEVSDVLQALNEHPTLPKGVTRSFAALFA